MPPTKKSKTSKVEEDPEMTATTTDDKEKQQDEEPKQEENDDDDDEDEEEDEIEKKEETDNDERGRGKRQRRQSKGYEPDDFTIASERAAAAAKAASVPVGRGVKLRDIAVVKTAIEKTPLGHEDLPFAYHFLFTHRGKVAPTDMKQKLLEFSGYLPALSKAEINEEAQNKEDERIETKYATKAYKLTFAQIRNLCDFFCVDQQGDDGKSLNKEETIDRLLDFLGEPDEDYTVEELYAKKKRKSKKKAKALNPNSIATTKEEDPFAAVKEHTKGDQPSDKALRQWVKAYVVCYDMEIATTKHAILTASEKFGVDLAPRKETIKNMLADEV